MSKIGLIIGREYKTRVRKKSFIVMTLLGPILFAALMVAPAILMRLEDDDFKNIAVIDETGMFDQYSLKNTKSINFDFVSDKYFRGNYYDVSEAKADLKDSEHFALLYIPINAMSSNNGSVQLFSYQQPNMGLKMHISNGIEKKAEELKLSKKAEELEISQKEIDNILMVANTSINVITTTMNDDGTEKESSTTVAMIIGYLCGFLIYMFIFMYGSMVMNGVIEEKSNRIVEVIVSSVKPFQLMLGKIIGVALVGITQFVLWVMLTLGIVSVTYAVLQKDLSPAELNPQTQIMGSSLTDATDVNTDDMAKFSEITQAMDSVNYVGLLLMFLFYFVGGYLLYAGMFAIAGSA
ncbi:MAG: ABC transporter permease, partial [Bacteroidales bacterium]|nr:ABC transporter permease [Bacteroidales bacterium]